MRKHFEQRRLWAILLFGIAALACMSCSRNGSVGTSKSSLVESKEAQPVNVLMRRTDLSNIAFDGAAFLDELYKAPSKVSPQAQEMVSLSTADGLKVEEERSVEVWNSRLDKKPKPKTSEWKLDPGRFDYLVELEVNSREETKYFALDPVKLAVTEAWKVSKVSDPTVTKTWKCNFTVDGGNDISSYEKAAVEQTERVVAPARGPILKELRDFIRASATTAKNAK